MSQEITYSKVITENIHTPPSCMEKILMYKWEVTQVRNNVCDK